MNYSEIMELTKWLEKSTFTSYSISFNGVDLSVSKQQVPAHPYLEQSAQSFHEASISNLAAENPKTLNYTENPTKGIDKKGHIIESPIVGIYYDSAAPEHPPFVEVGQEVKKGDVLCILEAMKVMNEITVDVDGVLAEIYASNGNMVEACMPLFRIEVGS
jgi:acetyl-CoA carboxylase biotin carboxyl carrier protein